MPKPPFPERLADGRRPSKKTALDGADRQPDRQPFLDNVSLFAIVCKSLNAGTGLSVVRTERRNLDE